jgi:uncharacterized protein YkwD
MVVCSALKDLIDRALLAGVMAAALVIAAPAASRGQDDSAPKQSHSGRAKQARTSLGVGGAAAMISSYRKRHGLPAVRADSRLMAIARRHAHAMAAQGRMSHDVGGDFSTRLRRGGYVAAAAAENIAAGQRSLSEAFSGWVAPTCCSAVRPGSGLLPRPQNPGRATAPTGRW